MEYHHSAKPVFYDGEPECRTCGVPVIDPTGPSPRHYDEPERTQQAPPLAVQEPLRRRPKVNRQVTKTGPAATSQRAAESALPSSGSLRLLVMEAASTAGGATDDEMEVTLNRPHQSVSASRNTLVADGWLEPLIRDGQPVTRLTRSGHDATVWTVSLAARLALREHAQVSA